MALDIDDKNFTGSPLEVRFCNFPTGSSSGTSAHDTFVKTELVPILTANPGAWIDLIGFASNLGFTAGDSHRKNRDLSEARCNWVKRLIQRYASGARFNVIDPEGDTTSTGGARNDDGYWRAVKIRIFGAVAPGPKPPSPSFVCGPNVTEQVADTWGKIRGDFDVLGFTDKIKACNSIFLPFKKPDGDIEWPSDFRDIEEWKRLARQFADINSWDTLPLFQGFSGWLRSPPVYDASKKGPCATPSSDILSGANQSNNFDDLHESDQVCSNTVQVGGQCWLNGTVNYGTLGIMVKACFDFSVNDWRMKFTPARNVYNLEWAKMLIRSYKSFGEHPEDAALPIAWTEATFHSGPRGVPSVAGNRPKCQCTCGCKGDVVPWDYVWDPHHKRPKDVPPWAQWHT
jgi:hypothetical protein